MEKLLLNILLLHKKSLFVFYPSPPPPHKKGLVLKPFYEIHCNIDLHLKQEHKEKGTKLYCLPGFLYILRLGKMFSQESSTK